MSREAQEALRLREGIATLLAGDARAAIAHFAWVLDRMPFHRVAHFNSAVAHRVLGHIADALVHANMSIELGRPLSQAHSLCGVLHLLQYKVDDAAREIERANKIAPWDRVARFHLARIRLLQARPDEAVTLLESAIEPGTHTLPSLVVERIRGQLFDLRHRPREGIERLRDLCRVNVITEILLRDNQTVVTAGDLDSTATATDVSLESGSITEITTRQAAEVLHDAQNIVVLTGAGLSAQSGLATRKEMWKRYNRDDAVSVVQFHRNPNMLWHVVREFLGDHESEPNPAHVALSMLPCVSGVITQNVDGLHQKARTLAGRTEEEQPIIELHGTLDTVSCHTCGESLGMSSRECFAKGLPPRCLRVGCGGVGRPDVVLFGEWVDPSRLRRALDLVERCDVLIVAGCAMDVAPASEIPRMAARHGAKIIEIKRSPSRIAAALNTLFLRGTAVETLRETYEHLRELHGSHALPALPASKVLPLKPWTPALYPVPLMPLGEYIVESDIAAYFKKPGDWVDRGESIGVIELDKISIDLEAPISGVIHSLDVEPYVVVPLHTVLARIEPSQVKSLHTPAPLRPEPSVLLKNAFFRPMKPSVRARLETLRTTCWLSPDVALEAESADAMDWLTERLDSHIGALLLIPGAPKTVPELSVWVTHDAVAAATRWITEWKRNSTGERTISDDTTHTWNELLVYCREKLGLYSYEAAEIDSMTDTVLRNALSSTQVGRAFLTDGALCDAWLRAHPARDWVNWHFHHGQEHDPPCPWVPIVQVWMRGGWTFPLPHGVLGVYIPRTRDGVITPCDGLPDVTEWVVDPRSANERRQEEQRPILRGLGAPPMRSVRG